MSEQHSAENDAPPCCPGAGTMAHVRGCRNHPEYERQARRCPVHHDPRTTEHYDRARGNLDRHGVHFLTAYVAGV